MTSKEIAEEFADDFPQYKESPIARERILLPYTNRSLLLAAIDAAIQQAVTANTERCITVCAKLLSQRDANNIPISRIRREFGIGGAG